MAKMKLTAFSKVLIILAVIIIGLLIFMKGFKDGNGEHYSTNTDSKAETEKPTIKVGEQTSESKTKAVSKGEFDYKPIRPINGKLKGVVELGASGFNSFIVDIDRNKDWKLEKAEWGNSLVFDGLASGQDINKGLKQYISNILDYGVSGQDIHFVVSSGAQKAENTAKIIQGLKDLGYVVNLVTPEQEGQLALKCVLPEDFEGSSFVVDIGSGNTKISWISGGQIEALESYGAKYYKNNTSDNVVYDDIKNKVSQIPSSKRNTCFLIGGVPFSLAKQVRNGDERFTVIGAPSAYSPEGAKEKSGINIYEAIREGSGCEQYVFDWDANFTIGFLLDMPY